MNIEIFLQNPGACKEDLDLTNQRLMDEDVAKLVVALKDPRCQVITINLTSNLISDPGARIFLEHLQSADNRIINVKLLFNRISKPLLKEIYANFANKNAERGVFVTSDAPRHLAPKFTKESLRCLILKHSAVKVDAMICKNSRFNQLPDELIVKTVCMLFLRPKFNDYNIWHMQNDVLEQVKAARAQLALI